MRVIRSSSGDILRIRSLFGLSSTSVGVSPVNFEERDGRQRLALELCV